MILYTIYSILYTLYYIYIYSIYSIHYSILWGRYILYTLYYIVCCFAQVAGAKLDSTDNNDVPEKVQKRLENAQNTLEELRDEMLKYQQQEEGPKEQVKTLNDRLKESLEEADKVITLVESLTQ